MYTNCSYVAFTDTKPHFSEEKRSYFEHYRTVAKVFTEHNENKINEFSQCLKEKWDHLLTLHDSSVIVLSALAKSLDSSFMIKIFRAHSIIIKSITRSFIIFQALLKEENKNRNYDNNMKNSIAVPITLENENDKRHLLAIPYQGEKGDYFISSMKRNLKKVLPNNVKPQITYTGRKLGSLF